MASESVIESVLSALEQTLRAGLPLTRTEWTHGLPGPVAHKLRRGVESGRPLADVLGDGLGLPPHERMLLGAAERSGTVPDLLAAILAGRQRRRAMRRKAMIALAYPCLVLFAAVIFLPLPLLFTGSGDVYFQVVVLGLLGVGVPLFGAFVVWPRLPPSRLKMLPWTTARALPLVGPRLAWGPTSVFTDVLGRSLAAGIPVTVALPSALNASGDPIFAHRARNASEAIQRGATLSTALQEVDDLPPEVVRQVAIGESSGKLEEVLRALSLDAGDRHRRTLWGLIVALGAAVFAVVALVAVIGIVSAAQTFYFDRIDSIIEEAER